MPQPSSYQMPALGFVGLGQYLDANRGVLGDQFAANKKRADTALAGSDPQADENLATQFGTEAGLAGNGAGGPTSGANSFDASLAWGAYGPQYKSLSETLNQAAHAPPKPPPAVAAPPVLPEPPQQDPGQSPGQSGGGDAGALSPPPGGSSPVPTNAGGGDAGPLDTAPRGEPVPNSGLRKALRQVGR